MSYSHFTSFAPTTVYDPSGVDGITRSMEQSFRLDSHPDTLQEHSSDDFAVHQCDAHCEPLAHSGLPVVFNAAEEYGTPWCSGSTPTWEIASALEDSPSATGSSSLRSSSGSSTSLSLSSPSSLSSWRSDTGAVDSGSSRDILTPSQPSPDSLDRNMHSSALRSSHVEPSSSVRGVSGPSSRRPQGPKKHRRSPTHTRSRLRQVKAEVLALKVSIARGRKDCKCTVCEKEFKCRSELWRHMKAHAGEAHGKKWKCCGVPVELAAEYDIARDAKPYIHNGRSMDAAVCSARSESEPTSFVKRRRRFGTEYFVVFVEHMANPNRPPASECTDDVDVLQPLWYERLVLPLSYEPRLGEAKIPIQSRESRNIGAKPFWPRQDYEAKQRKGQREAPSSGDPVTGSNTYKTTQPVSATDIRPPTLDPPTPQHTICRAVENMQTTIHTTLDPHMVHPAPQTPPATKGNGPEDQLRRHVPCRLRRMLGKMPLHATENDNEHRNLPPRLPAYDRARAGQESTGTLSHESRMPLASNATPEVSTDRTAQAVPFVQEPSQPRLAIPAPEASSLRTPTVLPPATGLPPAVPAGECGGNGPMQQSAPELVAAVAGPKKSAARARGPRTETEKKPVRRSARLLRKINGGNRDQAVNTDGTAHGSIADVEMSTQPANKANDEDVGDNAPRADTGAEPDCTASTQPNLKRKRRPRDEDEDTAAPEGAARKKARK
ncbi:predicted protein [Postia placenta Mad-698-R]|nr:predicted protein [Postia placenta Mad-698-R]